MEYFFVALLFIIIVFLSILLRKTSKNKIDNRPVKIKVFSCEQIKLFEEESSIMDKSIYPPSIYADKDGYYYGIEENSTDHKLYICKPKEWTEFVNSILNELSNVSYSDFLKSVLEQLPDDSN